MEDENYKYLEKLYFQLKSYLLYNKELLNILLKEDNITDNIIIWSDNSFLAINRKWIIEWKKYIGFDDIYKEIKNKNIIIEIKNLLLN